MSLIGNVLDTKQSQQLRMSLKLGFAIKMLTLSSLELKQDLKSLILDNPFIEINEDDLGSIHEINRLDETQDVNDNFEDNIHNSFKNYDNNIRTIENDSAIENLPIHQSLQDYLLWQLNLSHLTSQETLIGTYIIDLIDNNGYLRTPLQEITEDLKKSVKDITTSTIQSVLQLIQNYDPPGVGARSLQECLSLQLNLSYQASPYFNLALKIVNSGLETLGKGDLKKLCKQFDQNENNIKKAVALIKKLNPKPGMAFNDQDNLIMPDLIAAKQSNGFYKAYHNPYAKPSISINKELIKLCNDHLQISDVDFVKHHIKEAYFLMRSLKHRNETLIKVANLILKSQNQFMHKGTLYLRPLTLKQIAVSAGVHESTVSRITSLKYIQTPIGTFELKYFFSSGIHNNIGEASSSLAIKARIKQLVDNEDHEHPQSDSEILRQLLLQGFKISRRTVAKYRESLGIDTALHRKTASL